MAWAATAPYLAAQAIARGQGAARAQRVPGRVGDATRVDDRRSGRGARGAVVEAEPRGAVRLVPAAGLLRVDHAPAHDRVRHTARAVRRDRGRVPPAREPASRRGDARPADDDRRLPRGAVPRRPAAAARLVPDLRRRRRVRDDERRAGARPAARARGRAGRGRGVLRRAATHWALQRAFTSTPQVFSAPGAFAMAGLDARPTSTCSPCTTRSPS